MRRWRGLGKEEAVVKVMEGAPAMVTAADAEAATAAELAAEMEAAQEGGTAAADERYPPHNSGTRCNPDCRTHTRTPTYRSIRRRCGSTRLLGHNDSRTHQQHCRIATSSLSPRSES